VVLRAVFWPARDSRPAGTDERAKKMPFTATGGSREEQVSVADSHSTGVGKWGWFHLPWGRIRPMWSGRLHYIPFVACQRQKESYAYYRQIGIPAGALFPKKSC
jgi:hypothetical protein